MIARACHMLLMIILIMSGVQTQAQSFSANYHFKHLNVQNGLTQNIVYHFLQDSKGYIWVGTHNGLTMYDGINATSFMHDEQKNNSLASNFITRILEDDEHQIWLGNEKGINLFNRSNNTFTLYGVDRPGGKKDFTYVVPMGFVSATEFWFIDTGTKSIRAFNTKTKMSQFICEMNEFDGTIYLDLPSKTIHFWSYQSRGTIHLIFKERVLIKRQNFFSGNNPFPPTHRPCSSSRRPTTNSAWRRRASPFTRIGPRPKSRPNCIFTRRAGTVLGCARKTCPQTTGLTVSPNGWTRT